MQLPAAEVSAVDILTGRALKKGQLYFIFEVEGAELPTLTTYKRVVVRVTNTAGQGAGKSFETATVASDMEVLASLLIRTVVAML